jgi:hypothetical protein
MEPLLVGLLTSMTAVLGVAYWQLLVRPESLLQLWTDPDHPREEWFDHHPGALRALRYATGGMVFLFGFLTGLTLTFLLGT